MQHNHPNKMINPRQISNRKSPIVQSVKQATEIAMLQAATQSVLPRRELYTEETFSDNRIFVLVKHAASNRAFQFEFTTG